MAKLILSLSCLKPFNWPRSLQTKDQTPAGHKAPSAIWIVLSNPGPSSSPTEPLSLTRTDRLRAPSTSCCSFPLFRAHFSGFHIQALTLLPGSLLWLYHQAELMKCFSFSGLEDPHSIDHTVSQWPHKWIVSSVRMETMSAVFSNT